MKRICERLAAGFHGYNLKGLEMNVQILWSAVERLIAIGTAEALAFLARIKKLFVVTLIFALLGILLNASGVEKWNYGTFFLLWGYYLFMVGKHFAAIGPMAIIGKAVVATSVVASMTIVDCSKVVVNMLAKWMLFVSLAILLMAVVPFGVNKAAILPLLAAMIVLGLAMFVYPTETMWFRRISYFTAMVVIAISLIPSLAVLVNPITIGLFGVDISGGPTLALDVKDLTEARKELDEEMNQERQVKIHQIMTDQKLSSKQKQEKLDELAKEIVPSSKMVSGFTGWVKETWKDLTKPAPVAESLQEILVEPINVPLRKKDRQYADGWESVSHKSYQCHGSKFIRTVKFGTDILYRDRFSIVLITTNASGKFRFIDGSSFVNGSLIKEADRLYRTTNDVHRGKDQYLYVSCNEGKVSVLIERR